MRILCKEKDYYDHIGFSEYGSEDVIFDRRKYTIFEKSVDAEKERFCRYARHGEVSIAREALHTGYGHFEPNVILAINAGYNVYAFKVFNKGIEDSNYSIEFIGMRKCYELHWDSPLGIFRLEPLPFDHRTSKEWMERWKLERKDKDRDFETAAFLNGNPANWKFEPLFTDGWDTFGIPILKHTSFPKYMEAKEVYYAIEEWLIAQHNDVDQESEGLTDIDKAVNHGFDKKVSFRKM